MAAVDKFIENVFNEHLTNLHTAMPCTVVEYHEDDNTADLQPDFKRIKGGVTKDYPMIQNVPILEHVLAVRDEPELEPGEKVLVVFAERALDGAPLRRHDLTDAVIVGVF